MAPGFALDITDMEFLIEMLSERAAKGDDHALQIMTEFLEALGIESTQEQREKHGMATQPAQSEPHNFAGRPRWWS